METFETLVLVAHVLAALAIIGLVLIQHGKGADMGSGFGSGASTTVFGSGGAGNFLTRMTTGIVIAFFLTSFTLAFFAKEKSVAVRDLGIPVVQEAVIPDPVDVLSDEGAGELPEFDDMSGEQQVDSEIPES
jgi:preprotein translocase subunit SecG